MVFISIKESSLQTAVQMYLFADRVVLLRQERVLKAFIENLWVEGHGQRHGNKNQIKVEWAWDKDIWCKCTPTICVGSRDNKRLQVSK